MIDRFLVKFNRDKDLNEKSDLLENLGNTCLGLLRIGFGKTYTFKYVGKSGITAFKQSNYSTAAKVTAIALYIITFPLMILFTGIGMVALACSKSHRKVYKLYVQSPSSKKFKSPIISKKIPLLGENRQNKILNTNSITQVRKIPPISRIDTVEDLTSENYVSAHGTGELFIDDEIIEKLDINKIENIGDNVSAIFTKNNKAIIQQQATRGCTAATAAMLIIDHGEKPDIDELKGRNLGDTELQMKDIKRAGLNPILSSTKTLSELRDLIVKNDSAIVALRGRLGGHVIVIDEVSEDLSQIRLRDPYHGWEITVGSEAFLKEWAPGDTIQIARSS